MANPPLVLGPILRHVDPTSATVWVETAVAGRVEVCAGTARGDAATFSVAGHNYALVVVRGLAPGTRTPYEVRLDGETVWPEPTDPRPAPVIRTLAEPEGGGDGLVIAFGSCRVDRPHEPPYTLTADEHPEGVGVDTLVALSSACQRDRELPDLLVLLGDQVYADEGLSPSMRDRQVRRRGPDSEPRSEVADFEEYTWLYHESWDTPDVRWLLATVPVTMIFDDHDVRDDWNISEAWRDDMRRVGWWHERIVGAYLSYWIYQHIGNLSPASLAQDATWQRVQSTADATDVLRDFAARADEEVDGRRASRWSFVRELGRTRLVVVDTRSGRLLEGGRREMLSADEWDWVADHLTGDVDHLLVASSLPLVLQAPLHDVEAWSEAATNGKAFGQGFTHYAERMRRAADMEHWAAFEDSFRRMVALLGDVSAGRRGAPPASVLVLSGDVHHSYVAPLRYPAETAAVSPVLQVVSSPLRNGFPRSQQRAFRLAHQPWLRAIGRLLRLSARLQPLPVQWRVSAGPLFGNGIALLSLRGRSASVGFERAEPTAPDGTGARLRTVHEEPLC